MDPIEATQRVAQIVLEHPACGAVLRAHHIDYCCGGASSLLDACRRRRVDPAAVLAELERAAAQQVVAPDPDPCALSTSALVEHIVARHHGYLRDALPFLDRLAARVDEAHGVYQPALHDLRAVVTELGQLLLAHLDDEERRVFPALLADPPEAEGVAHFLRSMRAEHREVGQLLGELRALTAGFEVPEWACASYRALLGALEALEDDVMRHVHLENHVLAPRFPA